MGDSTGIGWTDRTFNPWLGCEKVSPGCAHCYAETMASGRMGLDVWGDSPRRIAAESTWAKPLAWNRESERYGRSKIPGGHEGERIRVFCASMGDVFEDRAEVHMARYRLFDLIAETPHLDWQVLTKRPEFAREWLRRYYDAAPFPQLWTSRDSIPWGVHPNLWMGVSIENSRFTWRADVLRDIPAAVRFISAEPLLGSLFDIESRSAALARERDGESRRISEHRTPDGTQGTHRADLHENEATSVHGRDHGHADGQASLEGGPETRGRAPLDLSGISWVIVGGESGGHSSRPMHPAWAREIRDAVSGEWPDYITARLTPDGVEARHRSAFYFKQWGSWSPVTYSAFGLDQGGVFVGLLPDGRQVSVAEAADAGGEILRYAGASPKSSGKHLDGRQWCQFPTSPDVLALV